MLTLFKRLSYVTVWQFLKITSIKGKSYLKEISSKKAYRILKGRTGLILCYTENHVRRFLPM